jgi:hypothetical protein
MGYASRRFIPIMAFVATPLLAENLAALVADRPRWRKVTTWSCLGAGLATYAAFLWVSWPAPRPGVFSRADAPLAAARFIERHAPEGSPRLLAPFNAGPWLNFIVGPRVKLFVDPRNSQGASALRQYLELTRPSSAPELETTLQRSGTTLILVDLSDGRMSTLSQGLAGTPRGWALVYWDTTYALYAARRAANQRLIDQHGFRVIRARFDLEYLLALDPQPIDADVRRVAPSVGAVIEAYRLLSRSSPPPGIDRTRAADNERARDLLRQALPHLPPSPALLCYLIAAELRQGNRSEAQAALNLARSRFPRAPHVLAALAVSAQSEGKREDAHNYYDKLRSLIGRTHSLTWAVRAELDRPQ